ncbi:hypothetical protein BRARA_G01105 [Brassica rapa]|uniref:Uncharacterized protein n=2 Tax=Brassica TaxID=3705 RepID=A0A397YLS7_BRACM|nr:hypothetical protein BRARA_G01105 [Brassica rapa]CAF2162512.1 unnamed protein product [Brassica napus]CAG7902051.1 unnamed protein product [Brassica rapa]CDY61065.1 BnaA07g37310D [Brassica napus]VDC97908.1 unnamed protein product [Brassica rapa]
MSEAKTSRRSFGFIKSFMRLIMCFDATAEGDRRGRSKKLSRRSSLVHSIKSTPPSAFLSGPMVDEERDEKIKDVILYCKMNSPLNLP